MAHEPSVRFFVEPKTIEANARIVAYLGERCIADNNWHEAQEDTEGKLHDVWEVPDLRTMRLIRSMEREDSRVIIGYWKRDLTGGARLQSANYIVIVAPGLKVRRTAAHKKAVRQIPKRATA
jgi:hypothetical protein